MPTLTDQYPGLVTIPLLDGALCQAEADVEKETVLSGPDKTVQPAVSRRQLADSYNRLLALRASGAVGSPSLTIDSLSASFDGQNWHVVQNFTPLIITGNTNAQLIELTVPLGPALKLRLDATVTTLNGSNYLTLHAALYLVPRAA